MVSRHVRGHLLGVCDTIPYTPSDPINDPYYSVISWVDHPFTDEGDSGSLVYTLSGHKVVPIGIHKGSLENLSYCLLLNWVVGTIESELDRHLLFCPNNCSGP